MLTIVLGHPIKETRRTALHATTCTNEGLYHTDAGLKDILSKECFCLTWASDLSVSLLTVLVIMFLTAFSMPKTKKGFFLLFETHDLLVSKYIDRM